MVVKTKEKNKKSSVVSKKKTSAKKRIRSSYEKPLVLINFKTYEQATGDNALELALICEKVALDTGANIIVAVQPTDIRMIAETVSIPVYSQHIDPVTYGSFTGHVTPESVKQAGAAGTLLNHSENRLRIDILQACVIAAKNIGIKTVICANDAIIGQAVNSLEPDYIAVEPPELIGGDISVSDAKPSVIKESVKRISGKSKKKTVLVGAGIKTNKDFKKSIKLGANGVLIASGITKAKDPEKALRDLIKGIFKK
ncbi:MAG: triose-phosphate isomerase [Candidatus Woesearchaeota archaeon]